jgi:hypothetical protein
MIFPLSSTIILSAKLNAERRWDTIIVVFVRDISRIAFTIFAPVSISTWLIGSSRSKMGLSFKKPWRAQCVVFVHRKEQPLFLPRWCQILWENPGWSHVSKPLKRPGSVAAHQRPRFQTEYFHELCLRTKTVPGVQKISRIEVVQVECTNIDAVDKNLSGTNIV